MKQIYSFVVALFLVLVSQNALCSEKPLAEYGIILMHGTGTDPGALYARISRDMEEQGAVVVRPYMPWSGQKGTPYGYKKSVPDVLNDIDGYINQLKSKGIKHIVLAGHSLGVPIAMAYAAENRTNIKALILLAPGQVPDLIRKRAEGDNPVPVAQLIMENVKKAKELVEMGKGDEIISYPFLNQGLTGWTNASSKIFLSYWDPDGPIVMPKNAVNIPASTSVIYVIGNKDPLFIQGKDYFFNKLPENKNNLYLEVNADHANTPDISSKQVVDWLLKLSQD